MKRYFVTGTDTDCGKTYFTAQLIQYLTRQAKRAVALKPVASGMREIDGLLQNEDVYQFQLVNPCDGIDDTHFWRFNQPIAPHLAAASEGRTLDAQQVVAACQNAVKETCDYVLIEGAGGLMAPLNGKETWIDFLLAIKIPVIFVVGIRLGCLNHALLTHQALLMNHIPCTGWVANCIDKDMLACAENIATLESMLSVPLLATLPFGGILESMNFNI